MKKTAALILCVLFALLVPFASAEEVRPAPADPGGTLPGSTVVFGHYEQDGNADNGKEPIEWIVLEYHEEESTILVVSKTALDSMPYYDIYTDTSWEESSIRTWLNSDFLQEAFTAKEQQMIVTTQVSNLFSEQKNSPDNGNIQTSASESGTTADQVFLLSYNEVFNRFFTSRPERMCKTTPYAVIRGVWTVTDGEYEGNCVWMLRGYGSYVDAVDLDGDSSRVRVDMTGAGIRPTLWINLSQLQE